MLNTIIHGKWEDWLPQVPDASVDMVLLDPPYNTTANDFDRVPFDLQELWKELKRVAKPKTAFVFTASQPFTTDLINSNRVWFKYTWVWEKDNGTNFFNADYQPLKVHEDVVVFSAMAASYSEKGNMWYYPQTTKGKPYSITRGNGTHKFHVAPGNSVSVSDGARVPRSVIKFNSERGLHPTQKPVSLWSYLVRTYSMPGDVVLDCSAGSFTTAEACIITGRNWICIEKDEKYCQVGRARIAKLQMQPSFAEMVG